MFKHAADRKMKEYEALAVMHGAKLKDTKNSIATGSRTGDSKKENFIFKSSEEYDHMTPEEKQILTEKMMNFHRTWGSKSALNK